MATQIHMAGRIWTSVRRQLVNRVLTPWNSMANPPTRRASGASHRLRWLRARTACLDRVVVAVADGLHQVARTGRRPGDAGCPRLPGGRRSSPLAAPSGA